MLFKTPRVYHKRMFLLYLMKEAAFLTILTPLRDLIAPFIPLLKLSNFVSPHCPSKSSIVQKFEVGKERVICRVSVVVYQRLLFPASRANLSSNGKSYLSMTSISKFRQMSLFQWAVPNHNNNKPLRLSCLLAVH